VRIDIALLRKLGAFNLGIQPWKSSGAHIKPKPQDQIPADGTFRYIEIYQRNEMNYANS
jgi:hypothetical protein